MRPHTVRKIPLRLKRRKDVHEEKYEGIYTDPEVFNVTEEEVSDFDKNFPPKEKLVLPGQLN